MIISRFEIPMIRLRKLTFNGARLRGRRRRELRTLLYTLRGAW